MSNSRVVVPIAPPVPVVEGDKEYRFGEDLSLPKSQVSLVLNSEGLATGAKMPKWLAEDRGLIAAESSDEMSRSDWFLLGAMMALLIRGEEVRNAVWEARKVVAKLEEQDG